MVRESCPVCHFLGFLSGSSELGWGSVELLRTYDVHFSISECTLRSGLCLDLALWVFHAMSLVALFPGAGVGCPLLSSQALWRRLRPLPCSSVYGLHCTGPTNARQSQWESVISCAGSQVFLVRLGGALSAMRAFMLPQVVVCRRDQRSQSPSGSGCHCHGGAGSRSQNGLFCVP